MLPQSQESDLQPGLVGLELPNKKNPPRYQRGGFRCQPAKQGQRLAGGKNGQALLSWRNRCGWAICDEHRAEMKLLRRFPRVQGRTTSCVWAVLITERINRLLAGMGHLLWSAKLLECISCARTE